MQMIFSKNVAQPKIKTILPKDTFIANNNRIQITQTNYVNTVSIMKLGMFDRISVNNNCLSCGKQGINA